MSAKLKAAVFAIAHNATYTKVSLGVILGRCSRKVAELAVYVTVMDARRETTLCGFAYHSANSNFVIKRMSVTVKVTDINVGSAV